MDKKTTISTSYNIAYKLKVLAKEKESVRRKLAVTAEKLRLKAKQLAVTAKEKESVRRKLAVTAKALSESRKTLEKKIHERTKSLANAKARDEAMLASIGDGLVMVDKKGKIVYVNKSFEEMLGWKGQEIIGKSMVGVVPREDQSGAKVLFKERILTHVLSGEKFIADLTNPFYYIRKDKGRLPVSSIVAPVVLGRKIVGAVETFRDISKEKEVDKTKTEFASLVSHQLRTPFSTINWYVELLLSQDVETLNEKQIKYLEEIEHASKRMVNLINVLLSISRIEMGTTVIEKGPVDIVKLAETVLNEFQPELQKKNLRVSKIYDKNISLLQVDSKQLFIIFQNLLSNSIKYTSDGGKINLTVGLKKDDIIITIADTGMGIPKEIQPKIFTRFFRADNAKEVDAEGIGLGLYIVKAVVEQMAGKIWFESKRGKGTKFYVILPLHGMAHQGDK